MTKDEYTAALREVLEIAQDNAKVDHSDCWDCHSCGRVYLDDARKDLENRIAALPETPDSRAGAVELLRRVRTVVEWYAADNPHQLSPSELLADIDRYLAGPG